MSFDQGDALKIAQKLDAEIKEGRRHTRVTVVCEGYTVGSFGIQRGTKEKDHVWIPRQISLSKAKTRELCQCAFSKKDYFEELQKKGIIPSDTKSA